MRPRTDRSPRSLPSTSGRPPEVGSGRRFIGYWLPVGLWCAIIFVQSAFATPDIGPRWPHVDKVAHVGVYVVLSILFCRAFNTLAAWRGRSWRLIVTGAALTSLYGALDEWHQSFVAVRTADGMDLLADVIGGVLGACLYVAVGRYRRRHLTPAILSK
ncbi:VanZ family protein [Desulfatitalea tepidiphila]|uniref:VanZ family protein n=1 Tax=Desulfatitalea tepidiphila TaxID=1185843 RepID=UPI0006B609BE|nr:VanZ family protein [Desulfatitalea tepidiphila]